MDPTATATAGGGAGGAGAAGGGNAQLQQAFNTAIQQAGETLSISTAGQAQLNALRARPQ